MAQERTHGDGERVGHAAIECEATHGTRPRRHSIQRGRPTVASRYLHTDVTVRPVHYPTPTCGSPHKLLPQTPASAFTRTYRRGLPQKKKTYRRGSHTASFRFSVPSNTQSSILYRPIIRASSTPTFKPPTYFRTV